MFQKHLFSVIVAKRKGILLTDTINYTKNSVGYVGCPKTVKEWFSVCWLDILHIPNEDVYLKTIARGVEVPELLPGQPSKNGACDGTINCVT